MTKFNLLSTKRAFIFLLVIPLMTVVLLVSGQQPATAENTAADLIANCRYGVGVTKSEHMLDDLKVGTAVNFVANAGGYGPQIDYLPTIRLRQNKDAQGNRLPSYTVSPSLTSNGLGALVDAYPGRLWLVGNEVDRVDVQDDMMPDIYADAYHEVYHFIKDRDPSAQVAVSGLVRVSPGRLQYLDIVWDSYLAKYGTQIPVDVWNMHAYNIPEIQANGQNAGAAVALGTDPNLALIAGQGLFPRDPSVAQINQICGRSDVVCTKDQDSVPAFMQQIVDMRQWMKAHGEQNKPLIISEFSILAPYNPEGAGCFILDELQQCFTPQRVSNYMVQVLDYLESAADPDLGYPADGDRLVQSWVWYATSIILNNDEVASSSKLVADNGIELTQMGRTYRNYAAYPSNLTIRLISEKPSAAVAPTAPATFTLSAVIRNSGTIPTNDDTTVTFRDSDGQLIETVMIQPGVGGCAYYPETVSVQWENVPAGTHRYNVFINDVFAGSSIVMVAPAHTVFLPISMR